ncbi:antibiotic biosynthesis monooxygenase [Enemella evansiae]|uniref:putative quinol monooxygenase n=1 Tax=Enemella evansiae TaxID=2016499 RepID=UPI000B979753|nr:putative quinol monooxygenase [Enemella evansiae]OYO02141.1 antibiotic biosynthesis monooxygenase [Enemella evansiae]
MTKVLYAEFTATPGNADRVAELLAGLARDVRAEEGNLIFDAHRLSEDRDKFFVYEVYRDDQAFETHIAAPYGAVFNAALNDLIVEDHSVLTFLDPIE